MGLSRVSLRGITALSLPTTPNPTSGFYLVVPEESLFEVGITVEDAFKVIMSAGLVSPETIAVTKRRSASGASADSPVDPPTGAAKSLPEQ